MSYYILSYFKIFVELQKDAVEHQHAVEMGSWSEI